MRKYLKNSIATLVIVSIILVPYLNAIPQAEAQFNYGGVNYGGGTSGIGGYISGLAPTIAQLPLCQAVLQRGIRDLFGLGLSPQAKASIKNAVQTGAGGAGINADTASVDDSGRPTNLGSALTLATSENTGLEVTNPTSDAVLNTIANNTTKTAESTASANTNDTCLKSIGRMVTKLLLQKLTVATVAYINGGNFGDSFYPKDRSQTFWDIAQNEILKFNGELTASGNPFGLAFMQNQALALNNHFQQNAHYSLNELIAQTTPTCKTSSGQTTGCDIAFRNDFTSGGWNAWNALTQIPANNPLGFQFLAANELSQHLVGTQQTAAQDTRNMLQEAGGFLGQVQCTSPMGLTPQQEKQNLIDGDPGVNGSSTPASYAAWKKTNTCQKWEYVTPGKVIADATTRLVNYPDNQYLKAQDLNDALAAITDAWLASQSAKLMSTTGLAGISPNDGASGPQYYAGAAYSSSQTEQDFTVSQRRNSTWLGQNPDFNFRTDTTQALIDDQRTYLNKLQEENTQLPELIKWINQLDYCIPGPNPDWEVNSQTKLDTLVAAIPPIKNWFSNSLTPPGTLAAGYGAYGLSLGLMFATLQQGGTSDNLVGVLGPALGFGIGAAAGYTIADLSNTDLKTAATGFLGGLLGVTLDPGGNSANGLYSTAGIKEALQKIFDEYTQEINKIYFTPGTTYMPSVTSEARTEFGKITGYQDIIKKNTDEISKMNGTITSLIDLKTKINDITNIPNYDPNDITLKSYGDAFARLSDKMVSGNDIANINDFLAQIQDQIDYISHSLVGSPTIMGSCEYDLSQLQANNPADFNKYAVRQSYPRSLPLPTQHNPISYPYSNDNFLKNYTYGYGNSTGMIRLPDINNKQLQINSSNGGTVLTGFEKLIGIY